MIWAAGRPEPILTYNFSLPDPPTIEDVCDAMCSIAGYPPPLGTVPLAAMLAGVHVMRSVGATSVHPNRVMKLVHSTHIAPDALLAGGYEFETTLTSGLRRWFDASPGGVFA